MRLITAAVLAVFLAAPAHAQLAPPDANGITFGHVHLNVQDVALQKKIFIEQFGAVDVSRGALSAVKLPNMIIAFTQAAATGGSEGTVMDHFGFKVQNLAEILAKWRAAGYAVTQEFTGAEGFPNAYLMGPEKVRIELQEDKTMTVKVIGYHIHFWTADFMKLIDWYVDTFGMTKRQRGSIRTTADMPGMNFSYQSGNMTVATKGRTIDHIGFEVKNLQDFCKKLEAKGIKFDIPYRDVPSLGLKVAYLTDPNGVYIELTEGLDKY